MLLLGVYLFNLFCGFVPCDPNFGLPTIRRHISSEQEFRNAEVSKIPPRVTISSGSLEGYHMKSVEGKTIFAFEGVPYGKAERWKASVPPDNWIGVLKAIRPGSDCLQISAAKLFRVYGKEDCLFVNVYTPNLPPNQVRGKYPVLIYFHAGSFIMGSGSENGPAYLLNQDIVLVTVNYRLGVLGFLSMGDSTLPGNYGLKDQALSIEWVSKNIEAFGGDPQNINLLGYSAGGVSAALHMISNRTRPLFRRAISLGAGSPLQHWAVQSSERARHYARRLGRRLNCPTTGSSKKLLNCLKNVPVNFLVAEQLNFFDWFPFPPVFMAPVVEPMGPDAFLTETPEHAYKRGAVASKPWMVGTTSHEGLTGVLLLKLFQRWLPFRLNWNYTSKAMLDLTYLEREFSVNLDGVVEKIKKFYLGDKSPLAGTAFEYAQMITHRFLHFGLVKGIQAHSQVAPTYAYYFSFRKGNYSLGNLNGIKSSEWAPGHAEDSYFLFNVSTQYPGFAESDPDYKVSAIMINLLTNFISSGEPSYRSKNGELLHLWEQGIKQGENTTGIGKTKLRLLQISEDVKMIDYPDLEQLKFWQNLKLKDMVPWVELK